MEHLLHVFLDCCFAKSCWQGMGFSLDALSIEDCNAWLLNCMAEYSTEKMINMAKVLWGIWSVRNIKVWDGRSISAEVAM